MSAPLLILRPQPGAARTADRARKLGVAPVVASLFTVRPLAWETPEPARFDALMLTSANAVRHAGPRLKRYLHLSCYAVGEATAAAARAAGFAEVRVGPSDAAALAADMARDGVTRPLHLAGRHHAGGVGERRIVYTANAVAALPPRALAALDRGAVVLVHSPRAGALFARLFDAAGRKRARTSLAAISAGAAGATGGGWKAVFVSAEPRDAPLLELAAKLCQTAPGPNGPPKGRSPNRPGLKGERG